MAEWRFLVSAVGESWTPVGGVVQIPLVIGVEVVVSYARCELIKGEITSWEVELIEPIDTAPVTDTGRDNIASAFAKPPR